MELEQNIDPDLCVDPNSAETFSCPVCLMIPLVDQYYCTVCEHIFCLKCTKTLKGVCPYRCIGATFVQIQPIIKRSIESIKLKCKKCSITFTAGEYIKHLPICGQKKCAFRMCPQPVDPNQKTYVIPDHKNPLKFCSLECKFAYLITVNDVLTDSIESDKKLRKLIVEFTHEGDLHTKCKAGQQNKMEDAPDPRVAKSSNIVPSYSSQLSGIESINGTCDFKWDTISSQSIQLSHDGKAAYLQESGYFFRSVVADRPFRKGIFYWEIHADNRTDNEIKIGVVLRNQFNMNTSFSDYDYGYAFYGLGQLRHGNNAVGMHYGKVFKNAGILGVCLNMYKGTLSFALNNEFLGIAFTEENLTKEPIYAAASLLHKAGFKLVAGKPLPSYFLT